MSDLESSKLIYAIDNNSANPVTKSVIQIMTTRINGDLKPGCSPAINNTAVIGIIPMMKLMAEDMADEAAKISGLT